MLSPSNWRAQRAVVHSINRPGVLSKMNIPSGVTSPPRDYPSSSIPRHGSLVFHPTEMLYGVGSPDGTGKLESGTFSRFHLNTHLISACHWMQAPLGSCAGWRSATAILYHDIFPSPSRVALLYIISVPATTAFSFCFVFTLLLDAPFTICYNAIDHVLAP
jgi:hypothetical protein